MTQLKQPDAIDKIRSALIICFGLIKGGTAKTTSVIYAALWFALCWKPGRKKPVRVLAIDADSTAQSLYTWWLMRKRRGEHVPFDVIRHHPADDLGALLDEKAGEYDVILVDIGGGDTQGFHEVNKRAALLIMPSSPSGYETARIRASMKAAEAAASQHVGDGLDVYVALVRCDSRNTLEEEARIELTERKDPFPLADASISSLVHYPRSWNDTPTVAQLGDYGALLKEVLKGVGVR